MDIFLIARSFHHDVLPGFSKLNIPFLDRTMEKTGLTSSTWIILIWNLARGRSFRPIHIRSIVTTSNPLFRTLTSSDRPKLEKKTMPILLLIRTSIPRAVDAAASICDLKALILSRRARMPAKTTSAMTPVILNRTFFLYFPVWMSMHRPARWRSAS